MRLPGCCSWPAVGRLRDEFGSGGWGGLDEVLKPGSRKFLCRGADCKHTHYGNESGLGGGEDE